MKEPDHIETTFYRKLWIFPILVVYFLLAIFICFFISRRYIVHSFEYIIKKQNVHRTAFLMLIIKWFHSLPEFFSSTLIDTKDLKTFPLTFYGIYSTFLGILFPIVLLLEKEDDHMDSTIININFSFLFIILTILTIIFIIGYCPVTLMITIYFTLLVLYFAIFKYLNIHVDEEQGEITSREDTQIIIFIRKVFDFVLVNDFSSSPGYKFLGKFCFNFFLTGIVYTSYMHVVHDISIWGQCLYFCVLFIIVTPFYIFRRKESTYKIITLILAVHYVVIGIYEIGFVIKDFPRYIHLNETIVEMYLPALATGLTEIIVCYSLEIIGSYTVCTFIILIAPVILVLTNFASLIGVMIISESNYIIIKENSINFFQMYIANMLILLSLWLFHRVRKTFYDKKFLISLIIFSFLNITYTVLVVND